MSLEITHDATWLDLGPWLSSSLRTIFTNSCMFRKVGSLSSSTATTAMRNSGSLFASAKIWMSLLRSCKIIKLRLSKALWEQESVFINIVDFDKKHQNYFSSGKKNIGPNSGFRSPIHIPKSPNRAWLFRFNESTIFPVDHGFLKNRQNIVEIFFSFFFLFSTRRKFWKQQHPSIN